MGFKKYAKQGAVVSRRCSIFYYRNHIYEYGEKQPKNHSLGHYWLW